VTASRSGATTATPDRAPHATSATRDDAFGWVLLGVWLVALGIRLAYVWWVTADDLLAGDASRYVLFGQRIADGLGMSTPLGGIFGDPAASVTSAQFPPLFPFLLAAFSFVGIDPALGLRIAMALFGSLTPVLVGLGARTLAGRRAGAIAAAVAAVYPSLWLPDGILMGETLAGVIVAALVWATVRAQRTPTPASFAVVGLLVGAAALARTELVVIGVLMLGAAVLTTLPTRRQRLARLALAFAVTGVVVAPWVVRNNVSFDGPVAIATNTTDVLGAANCETTWSGPQRGSWSVVCLREGIAAAPAGTDPNDTASVSPAIRATALDFVADNLDRLPGVMVARLGRATGFFDLGQQLTYDSFVEQRERALVVAGLWMYFPLLGCAVVGTVMLWGRNRGMAVALAGSVLTVFAGAVVVYGSTRMRFAAEVPIVILAAVALAGLSRRLWPNGRRTPDVPETATAIPPEGATANPPATPPSPKVPRSGWWGRPPTPTLRMVVAVVVSAVVLAGAIVATDGARLEARAAPGTPSLGGGAAPAASLLAPLTGTWEFAGPDARLTAVPDGRRGLAAADLGATDGWVEAEGEPIGPSWGLALRIRDERNYTWVQFAPAFARIRIGVTEGGVDTEIGQLPLRAATAFARVRVEFVGEELSVWIDDRLSGTVRVPRPAGGTAVGLVGGANAIGTSTWRDLRAGPTTGTAATPGGSP
jgi:4-amino-4-deoxy-L-arabinose transferase-like glycosyltransferase